MSSKEVIVIVRLKAKSDAIEHLRTKITHVLEQAKTEPGYITCQLNLDLDDPTHFVLYEQWATLEDLLQYNNQPYHKEFEQMAPALCTEAGNFPSYVEKIQAARFRKV